MNKNRYEFLNKVIKSSIYTFIIVMLSMVGIYSFISIVFTNVNTIAEQSNTWMIICVCIGIIFTIFFCMFTILDELRKRR